MGPMGLLVGVVAVAGLLLMVLNLAVFSLMVAVSTVFWRLKLDCVWLLLLMRGAAEGGPKNIHTYALERTCIRFQKKHIENIKLVFASWLINNTFHKLRKLHNQIDSSDHEWQVATIQCI